MQVLILCTISIFDAYKIGPRIIESTGASPTVAMPIYDADDHAGPTSEDGSSLWHREIDSVFIDSSIAM